MYNRTAQHSSAKDYSHVEDRYAYFGGEGIFLMMSINDERETR